MSRSRPPKISSWRAPSSVIRMTASGTAGSWAREGGVARASATAPAHAIIRRRFTFDLLRDSLPAPERVAMHYPDIAIPDDRIPRAVAPGLQHVLDTYAS